MQKQFDYIILGAGLSGYTTALRMVDDPYFAQYQIAIIDEQFKKSNDRTWCFWEKEPSYFEALVSKKWEHVFVGNKATHSTYAIAPYQYKMIEGAHLYAFAKAKLERCNNVHFIPATVKKISDNGGQEVTVQTYQGTFKSHKVLNSIYTPSVLNGLHKKPLLQHFVGWFVEVEQPFFNTDVARYMDFDIAQNGNCRFMYVLPLSSTTALFEYTLFSDSLLPLSQYEVAIKDYLKKEGVTKYKVQRTEKGSIPMSIYNFAAQNTKNILHIGTAGGWTKASTGYTFSPTLKHSKELLSYLKTATDFRGYTVKNRWSFYDGVLLNVLQKNNDKGAAIFTRLFVKNGAQRVFKFLDEQTTFWEELLIMWYSPRWLFFKSALQVLFSKK